MCVHPVLFQFSMQEKTNRVKLRFVYS